MYCRHRCVYVCEGHLCVLDTYMVLLKKKKKTHDRELRTRKARTIVNEKPVMPKKAERNLRANLGAAFYR